MPLVLPCGHTAPCLCQDIGQDSKIFLLVYSCAMPLVGQLLPHLYGAHTLVYPFVGIAFATVILHCHLKGLFRVYHLVYTLRAYTGKPSLKRLCLRRWY